MAKVRVYELAKDLNMTNRALLNKIRDLDIDVKSHMSSLEDSAVKEIKNSLFGKARQKNDLKVKVPETQTRVDDASLTSNARHALTVSPEIDERAINVSSFNGIVTIKGTVDAFWKKLKVSAIVYHLTGVIAVEDKLVVVPTGEFSDVVIATSIDAALERNVFVDTTDVTIFVANGVVTLSGQVYDYQAYRSVYDTAARTVGVVDVVNNLGIEPRN